MIESSLNSVVIALLVDGEQVKGWETWKEGTLEEGKRILVTKLLLLIRFRAEKFEFNDDESKKKMETDLK